MMTKLLQVQHRRVLSRQRGTLYLATFIILLYLFFQRSQRTEYQVWRQAVDLGSTILGGASSIQSASEKLSWTPPMPVSDEAPLISDEEIKELFKTEYDALGKEPTAGGIYGNTLGTLVDRRASEIEQEKLINTTESGQATIDDPFTFDPYPNYNSNEWNASHAAYVPCIGPTGAEVQDIKVFRGHPRRFPAPGFGSYDLLGIDSNICYERQARFGQYGLGAPVDQDERVIDWDRVDWGALQQECIHANRGRYDLKGSPNKVLSTYDPNRKPTGRSHERQKRDKTSHYSLRPSFWNERTQPTLEPRTALLLRSYTGKDYNDNDRQVIRALVTELSLRTGGEYQVFLLVHVRDAAYNLTNATTYRSVLEEQIPREFWNMTVLWSDAAVHALYPRLDPVWTANVHNAQWLSVQSFLQDNREFDFVWNWEMDSRVTGQHYDMLTKLVSFAKAQPRKGLWERNERFYIPSVHGPFDTSFRRSVESLSGNETIWGAPYLPFIRPVGPVPPTTYAKDKYHWGVGEEADLITLSPIFNPNNSGWILGNQVWGYNDPEHPSESLPRRTTIITQSRVSRLLLDIMHVENSRGNHVGSEMTPQTVALLHGLKAVYAPMPVFFDRAWTGDQLQRWFNGGPNGQSGGTGCAMGWGREGRFAGSTWYFRADPPQRLYNNWMGYEDNGIGGEEWEKEHGRPCLPAMFLHPVKDVKPREKGYVSDSRLPY
ncbi:hypothetical protein BR93DRAFT_43655 [Coniochaeta sp. PMI_546]|nr:hypothetical protein BR93DRAFT_43655 [Coniochaeta sp. PMI_546]